MSKAMLSNNSCYFLRASFPSVQAKLLEVPTACVSEESAGRCLDPKAPFWGKKLAYWWVGSGQCGMEFTMLHLFWQQTVQFVREEVKYTFIFYHIYTSLNVTVLALPGGQLFSNTNRILMIWAFLSLRNYWSAYSFSRAKLGESIMFIISSALVPNTSPNLTFISSLI